MKKIFLALSAAAMLVTPSAAYAATTVAQHGMFTVAALDDMQTCATGARNETAGFMVTYNAITDTFVFSGANKALKVTQGAAYKVNVIIDGKTFVWSGYGLNLSDGSGAVVMKASNSVDAAGALYNATTIALTMNPSNTKIVSLNSDANFEAALKDTISCAFMLKEMAAEQSSKPTT